MALQLFPFYNQNVIQKQFHRSIVFGNLLVRYMSMLTIIIDQKIKMVLSDCFAVISDGWSRDNTYYVSGCATFSADHACGFACVLWQQSHLRTKTSFRPKSTMSFLNIFTLYMRRTLKMLWLRRGQHKYNQSVCTSHRSFPCWPPLTLFNFAINENLATFDTIPEKVDFGTKKMSF